MENKEKIKVEELIGKFVKYEGLVYKVIKTKDLSGKKVISTDRRTFVLDDIELKDFIEGLEVVDDPKVKKAFVPALEPQPNKPIVPQKVATPEMLVNDPMPYRKIEDSLLSMLEKVEEDPNYIPRAKSVCDIANTLVNVERTKMQLLKLSREV
ncbi:hypothetical protein [Spongiimicrobium salis]|uniref:hypothetical protein n=1 Tax=Spongiimicrobium salis TaxID=1667022 RepID=UPI00374D900B